MRTRPGIIAPPTGTLLSFLNGMGLRRVVALFIALLRGGVSQAIVSCPAGKIGGKIRLVTLRTILGTCSNFHMFRQEFERANRNAAFF